MMLLSSMFLLHFLKKIVKGIRFDHARVWHLLEWGTRAFWSPLLWSTFFPPFFTGPAFLSS